MKLLEITRIMQQLDSELCQLGELELSEIIGEILPEKVDNLYSVLSSYDAEIERLTNIITEFQATKKSMENSKERLKQYIIYCMESTGTTRLPGDRYSLSLTERESYEWLPNELMTDDFITLNQACPGIVKRSYVLDKSLAKKYSKEVDIKENKLWQRSMKKFIHFRVKKGV